MARNVGSARSFKRRTTASGEPSKGSATEMKDEISKQKPPAQKTTTRLQQVEMLLSVSHRVATIESLDEILEATD